MPGFLHISHQDIFDKSGQSPWRSPKQSGFTISHQDFLRISHPDCFRDPRGDCPDFSTSHTRIFLTNPGNHLGDLRNNPDSPFRIRIFSEIPEVMARISPYFTPRFSGQIRISHPDLFRDPRGDGSDFSAFHIRIFRTKPDFASGLFRRSPR